MNQYRPLYQSLSKQLPSKSSKLNIKAVEFFENCNSFYQISTGDKWRYYAKIILKIKMY